jgi:predicted transcriptional regulator
MFGLGDLESAVMAVLWGSTEPGKVREVLERLHTPKQLAYTTVLTVLDNLHRKGVRGPAQGPPPESAPEMIVACSLLRA